MSPSSLMSKCQKHPKALIMPVYTSGMDGLGVYYICDECSLEESRKPFRLSMTFGPKAEIESLCVGEHR